MAKPSATTLTPRKDLRAIAAEWLPAIALLVLLTAARSSFANHYVVPTGSMEDTLVPGDRVVVDMSAYGLRVPFTDTVIAGRTPPSRGEIVVFDSPVDGIRLIKRVVAVAGDEVTLRDGHLAINGVALNTESTGDIERFGAREALVNLDRGGGPNIDHLIIPAGKVLVLGDHRGNSIDGRMYGLVSTEAFYGKAVAVYWRTGEGPVWKRL